MNASDELDLSFLPYELIMEVLSSLPVKCLTRWRCVCKTWNTLFSNPTFVKLHLQQSTRNKYLTLILCNSLGCSNAYYFDKDCCVVPFSVNSLIKNPSITIVTKKHYPEKIKHRFQFIGSCNGLICFFVFPLENCREAWFHLWNPATKTISETFGKLSYSHNNDISENLKFAFGYDKSTNTYKVVAFRPTKLEIFSFGDNVWKNIELFPAVPLDQVVIVPEQREHVNESVYLNDTHNWLAQDIVKQIVIISLNLGTETYRQFLPPPDFVEVPPELPTISLLRDCLCFCYRTNKTHFVIWMMMQFGVEESWIQFLKIRYQDLHIDAKHFLVPLCLSDGGETLILATNQEYEAILYNWRANRVEKTKSTNKISWLFAQNHVESLVSTFQKDHNPNFSSTLDVIDGPVNSCSSNVPRGHGLRNDRKKKMKNGRNSLII